MSGNLLWIFYFECAGKADFFFRIVYTEKEIVEHLAYNGKICFLFLFYSNFLIKNLVNGCESSDYLLDWFYFKIIM